jgi:pimeloyl-ACP methyl ester carboxylesterase
VVVHGFPTSAFDFAHLLDHLATRRRVVLVDLLGFGLSDKPDQPYTMALQADVVAAVVDGLGLDRFALLTHDMGDTVGGELLARTLEGSWPVTVTRRVVTNGSIYIQMAQLTPGQLMLLSLPDEKAPSGAGVELLAASLAATLAPANAHLDMSAHAELTCHAEGDALLPRTIRYIEERRANERRFTGAIEDPPGPAARDLGPRGPDRGGGHGRTAGGGPARRHAHLDRRCRPLPPDRGPRRLAGRGGGGPHLTDVASPSAGVGSGVNQPEGARSAPMRGTYWSKYTRATSSRRLRTPAFSNTDFRWSCTV